MKYAAALLVTALAAIPAAAVDSASRQLERLGDEMVEREFDLDPLRETYTEGRGPRAGRALVPPTLAHKSHARGVYGELLQRLEKIPTAGLSATEANSHDLIRWRVKNELARLEAPVSQMQLLSPTSGVVSSLIFMATAGQPLENEADFEAWSSRLKETAANVDGYILAIEEARRAGWTTPRPLVEKALAQMASVVDRPADQGPLWSPVGRYPKSAGEAKRDAFAKRYRELLERQVIPQLERFAQHARQKCLPAARTTAGIGSLPHGDVAYRTLVRVNTTLDVTPARVHEIGLAEVERIRPKMLEVAARLGFKGTIRELPGWIESNASNYPFGTPDDVLASLRKVQARVTPELPKLFKRQPKAPLEIRLTPRELAATASASYSSPPVDNSRPGYFNMPVTDAKKTAVFGLTALFLHEGVPGHHLDAGLRRELDVPRFRRYSWITAYGEGWALYAESLGEELGVYEDDWALLGRYAAELQRAARLVVDTGIHAKGWTREEGIRYLVEERGSFERSAIVEVERYMAWPGQALAYKMGQMEISDLREKARRALGPRFDLREFHEAVLGEGPLTLPMLRKRVDAWIGKQPPD